MVEPEGYRAVLASMDYFKLVKGERVRFYSLLVRCITFTSMTCTLHTRR
jgi:hypothetical protein